jgi:hypothetical protein
MRVGVLGTGVVGQTLGLAFADLGHDVVIGSRTSPPATFAEAAGHGEILVNCTAGVHSLEALHMATSDALGDKILLDVANALDFSGGFPPTLSAGPDDSLAEQIQREFPRTRVVKALNTVTASVMVNPGALSEATDLFVAGDDEDAKAVVRDLLTQLGWQPQRIRDLGPLSAARSTEQYLTMWLALMGVLGTPEFNLRVVTDETTA